MPRTPRSPDPAAPEGLRLEPLPVLPVFFKLRGRRVVLAGGGPPAAWKAEFLSAAGATVEVLAEEVCDPLRDLAAAPADGPVTIHHRAWTPADLPGAALALGALDDEGEAAAFRAAAQAAGVPVNVIDKPAFCDFQFGTVVSRSPLVIGISTDGAAPVFGQAIRARIEALLPQSLRAWAEAARDWRPAVQARGLAFRARRRFWEVFAERALASPDASPTQADRDACLAAALAVSDPRAGTPEAVILVGAGRGRPDGITLQAIRALQDADIVFAGPTVSPVLVGFARREALKVVLDRGEAEALARVRDRSEEGRAVWLDGGNPLRCRRWDDRAAVLAAGGAPPARIEGLGLCDACGPGCPAWAAPPFGQAPADLLTP